MEVILKEDIINLGYKGDIVKVKDGYGRNYLIPTKKAVIASESAKKMQAEDQKQQAHKFEAIKNTAVALGEKIVAAGNLIIGTKTSSTGKIFGGVGPIQIAEALEKSGVIVDRKMIAVKTQVKEIGVYTASAKLHKDVTIEIPFEVVSE